MIRVGEGRGGLRLDAAKLAGGCALVQGMRGSGKSYLARVFLEQSLPLGLQTVILDPEGEYCTLREKCDVLIAGPDGDVPCDLRSAKVLARRIAELGCSTVVDLSGMVPADQEQFVADFLGALNRLPKSLEASRLIVIDEAHRFCPERGVGTAASTDEVILLMSQGRKRGLGALLVTQRLSKLSKNAASEAGTIFIGRTSPIDIKRAQDLLGITQAEGKDLRSAKTGSFVATGLALTTVDGVARFQARKATTTHPEPGTRHTARPKPPRGAMKRLISELQQLPEPPPAPTDDASGGSQGGSAADKQRIADLEAQLAGVGDLRNERDSLADQLHRWSAWIVQAPTSLRVHATPAAKPRPAPTSPPKAQAPKAKQPKISGGDNLSKKLRQMLATLIQHGPMPKAKLGLLVGMSPRGGAFSGYLAEGRAAGVITAGRAEIAATDAGKACVQVEALSTAPADLLNLWCGRVKPKAAEILRLVSAADDIGVPRDEVAENIGMTASGGAFAGYLSTLRKLDLIDGRDRIVANASLR